MSAAAAAAAFQFFSPSPNFRRSSPRYPILSLSRLRFRSCFKSDSYYHRSSYPNATSKVLCSQVKIEDDGDGDEACELVSGVDLIIGEGQDCIRAYLLKAVKNNNGTGVLLLSDVFGFEDSSTREFAYRIACNGYNVLLPDLFRGNPWKKDQPESESKSGFEHWLTSQSPERVVGDIGTSTKWLIEEFAAARISKKLGIIGFSFGGGFLIETLAKDEASNFGTGVWFYGSPAIDFSLAQYIKVPVLFICGDSDQLCPVDELQNIENSVRGSRVVIYSGRGHEFAHRPDSLEEDLDAENAFVVTRNWLHNGLVSSNEDWLLTVSGEVI